MLLPGLIVASLLAARADTPTPAPLDAGLRFKAMSLPSSVLTTWVFDESEPTAAALPHVGAWAVAGEFTIHQPNSYWTFYLERLKFQIADGYWDDVEQPPDHDDGNWVDPSDNFGMVVLGANTGQEWALTDKEKDVWLGFGLGGGLGIGIVTGELTQWHSGANLVDDEVVAADCLPDAAAYDRYEGCGDDGDVKIPPVLPMLDFNLSLDVHIAKRMYVRLEGGLHDLPYYGGAVGAHF